MLAGIIVGIEAADPAAANEAITVGIFTILGVIVGAASNYLVPLLTDKFRARSLIKSARNELVVNAEVLYQELPAYTSVGIHHFFIDKVLEMPELCSHSEVFHSLARVRSQVSKLEEFEQYLKAYSSREQKEVLTTLIVHFQKATAERIVHCIGLMDQHLHTRGDKPTLPELKVFSEFAYETMSPYFERVAQLMDRAKDVGIPNEELRVLLAFQEGIVRKAKDAAKAAKHAKNK